MFSGWHIKFLVAMAALGALAGLASAQDGERYRQKWTQTYDSPISGQDRAVSVAAVSGHAVTLVTSHRAGGAGTLVVYKTTRDGVRQWTTELNVPGWSYGEDFHGTAKVGGDSAGNVYLMFNARNLTSDRLSPAVAKLNADGSWSWTHIYQNIADDNANFEAMSAADFDLNGNVFMTGQSLNTITGNGGGFAMRIAPDQSVTWKRTFIQTNSQTYGKSITRDSRGNAYVAYYAPTATGGTGHVAVYDGTAGTVRFQQQIAAISKTTDLEPQAIETSAQYTLVVGRGTRPDRKYGFAIYYKPDGTILFNANTGYGLEPNVFNAAVITDHYFIVGGSLSGVPSVVFLDQGGKVYYSQNGYGSGEFTSLLVDKAETLHAVGHTKLSGANNDDALYYRWILSDRPYKYGDYPIQRTDATPIYFGSSGATAGNDSANGIALNKYGEVYVAGTIDPGGEYTGTNPPDSASYAFTTDLEQPPCAKWDTYTTDEDSGPKEFPSVMTNDVYASEATLQLVNRYKDGITDQGGTLVMRADGTFTYTPKPDFSGVDYFHYTLKHDGMYPPIYGKVTINVTRINDAPRLIKPIVFVGSNGYAYKDFNVRDYIYDDDTLNGDDHPFPYLKLTLSAPRYGTATANGTGYDAHLVYSRDGSYFGVDSFTVTAEDRGGLKLTTTAYIYTPYIADISPNTIPAGSPGFTMRVTGKGFAEGPKIIFRGVSLTPTIIDANTADVVIPASAIVTPGTTSVYWAGSTTNSRAFRILTVANIKLGATLTTDASGHHAQVTVRNSGQSPSEAVSITAARIETKATTTALPISLGTMAGGSSQVVPLDFPTAGAPGSSVLVKVTVLNGSTSKTYSIRVTL